VFGHIYGAGKRACIILEGTENFNELKMLFESKLGSDDETENASL
jgi:hypothetical protein